MTMIEIDKLKETKEYKAAEALTDALNSFSWNNKKFAKAMTLQHKTLQQSFMRTIVAVINEMANDEYNYDARNEASHNLAKQLQEAMKNNGYLPMI